MPRVIARLDIKGENVVKGVRMDGLRVIGKPAELAKKYAEAGADELLYMDTVASLYGRNSLLYTVEQTARELFIPLTVGGGIRTLDDVRAALRSGADKVAINTAAIERPEFIRWAARSFGSSTIVVSIEAKKMPNGKYSAMTQNGRERVLLDALAWAAIAAENGAGELLVTAIDRDGTELGPDLELALSIASAVTIPVIYGGGVRDRGDIEAVAQSTQAVAVGAALHFGKLELSGVSQRLAVA